MKSIKTLTLPKPLRGFTSTCPGLLLFLITFFLSLLYIVLSYAFFDDYVFTLFWDAQDYWQLATYGFDLGTRSFEHFSLYNYPDDVRGYFLPFLYYLFSLVGSALFNNGLYGFFMFNSAAIAFLASIVIPSMFLKEDAISPRKFYQSVIATVTFSLLLFFLWRWVFFEPLADFFAFFFAILSVKLLKMATDVLWVGDVSAEKTRYIKGFVLLFAAGLCAYAAYNTRTIYLFFFIATLVFILLGLFRKKNLLRKSLITLFCLFVFVLGFAVIGIPEAIINYNLYDTRSIMVITDTWTDADNLFFFQLFLGVIVERYETYLGGVYPLPGVHYITPSGWVIIERSNFTLETFSMDSFISLIQNHPFDMLAIYWRHFVNGLTPLFANVYVRDLSVPVIHMVIASFVLWFMCGISFFQRFGKRTLSFLEVLFDSYVPYWICVLIPCLFIIPSAMEVRFMLPLHIFLYSVLCYKTDYKTVYAYCKERPFKIIAVGLIIFTFWLTTISTTLISAAYGNFLLH